jgi:tripartite-type tricarboxylate transporter receptor subunit TctC
VKEFIQLAQQQPGKLNFGSAGTGGIPHLSGERFQALAGIKLTHVPYKGTALAMPDLMAGRLDVMFDSFSSSYPHVRDGKVRALGISASERSALVPDVPLISQDLPGYVSLTWFGVFGPAGLAPEIVATLNQALNKALKDPAVVQQLAGVGIEAVGGSAADFTQKIAEDTARWATVIKDAKISLQ